MDSLDRENQFPTQHRVKRIKLTHKRSFQHTVKSRALSFSNHNASLERQNNKRPRTDDLCKMPLKKRCLTPLRSTIVQQTTFNQTPSKPIKRKEKRDLWKDRKFTSSLDLNYKKKLEMRHGDKIKNKRGCVIMEHVRKRKNVSNCLSSNLYETNPSTIFDGKIVKVHWSSQQQKLHEDFYITTDKGIYAWKPKTSEVKLLHQTKVADSILHPDGRYIFIVTGNGVGFVYDISDDIVIWSTCCVSDTSCIAWYKNSLFLGTTTGFLYSAKCPNAKFFTKEIHLQGERIQKLASAFKYLALATDRKIRLFENFSFVQEYGLNSKNILWSPFHDHLFFIQTTPFQLCLTDFQKEVAREISYTVVDVTWLRKKLVIASKTKIYFYQYDVSQFNKQFVEVQCLGFPHGSINQICGGEGNVLGVVYNDRQFCTLSTGSSKRKEHKSTQRKGQISQFDDLFSTFNTIR